MGWLGGWGVRTVKTAGVFAHRATRRDRSARLCFVWLCALRVFRFN